MEVSHHQTTTTTLVLTEKETIWLNQAMDDFFRGQPCNLNELDAKMSKAFCEATTPKLIKRK